MSSSVSLRDMYIVILKESLNFESTAFPLTTQVNLPWLVNIFSQNVLRLQFLAFMLCVCVCVCV